MAPSEWIGVVVGALAIVSGVLAGLSWLIRSVVRDELTKATRPIQPGYRNGGESLADVAHIVKRIADRLEILEEELHHDG